MNPATVGLDLAKNVFHVHVADASGRTLDSKRLTRRELLPFFESLPSCLIGIEACATAHNWARQLQKLGHDVRLMPPGYVKPFVRRGAKNDATDAAAICEAVTRPNMRFVPIKSREDPGAMQCHLIRCSEHYRKMALLVSSVPLSLTIMPGLPRRSIRAVSSRATRRPEIEVSGMRLRELDQEAVTFILVTGVVGALGLGPAGIGGRGLRGSEEWNTE